MMIDNDLRTSGADKYFANVVIYDVLVRTTAEIYAAGMAYSDYWWNTVISQQIADIVDSQYLEDFTSPDDPQEVVDQRLTLSDALVDRARVLIDYLALRGEAFVRLCLPLAPFVADGSSVMVIGVTRYGDLLVQVNQ